MFSNFFISIYAAVIVSAITFILIKDNKTRKEVIIMIIFVTSMYNLLMYGLYFLIMLACK